MKSTVTQVRDIEKIEKELSANKIGLLSFIDKEENLSQVVFPYLYANKNIYFFFDDSDETYPTMIFEVPVKFTVYRSESMRKNSSGENNPLYKYFQVTFNGNIKQESEKKVIDELYKEFLNKYNFNTGKLKDDYLESIKLVFLDTEEIDATEVTGS